jgi:uncharacterized protein (TIGR02246 family)
MTNHFEKRSASKAAFGGCLALLLLASACGPSTPPDTRAADEAAIRDQDAQWAKAAAARDLDSTVAFYADDASLLPPNAPIATGSHAIRGVWKPLLSPDITLSWKPLKVEVARSGDLGYTQGVYQITTAGPKGNSSTENGKLVEVWKKQADGKWKVESDIFNSDGPTAAPPTEKKKSAKAHTTHSGKKHH